LREALTPSAETKGAYIAEFKFTVTEMRESGEEVLRDITVPWTTIKDIMKAILARADKKQEIGGADEAKKG
jgi:hypothetical protein